MVPTPFTGLVVVASGTFPGYKQADLKKIVQDGGGAFNSKVTDDCTHLVSTEKEVDNGGSKNKQGASVAGCKIVSLDWLLDSGKAKKKLSEKKYLFSSAATRGTPGQIDGVATATKTNGSKKRTVDNNAESDVQEEPPTKKQRDGQKAKSKNLSVLVDEGCQSAAAVDVYIDDNGLIWDAALNQTNAGNNNNKFYRVQLLKDKFKDQYWTWTRWGRVGELGQGAMLGDGSLNSAKTAYEKKFKDKSGLKWEDRLQDPKSGKYAFLERNYEDSDDEEEKPQKAKKEAIEERKPVESALPQPVQSLMSFIFNQQNFLNTMAQMSYDAKKLPLGKLSKRTLHSGFEILKELSELISDPSLATSKYGQSFNKATEDLSNRYFTMIPHDFRRNRPPVINHNDMVKKEVDLLENLTDMEIANAIVKDSKLDDDEVHFLDKQFQGLGMQEMTPLDSSSTEFQELEDYLIKSRGHTHHLNYKVQDIFRIERDGEEERFQQSQYANIKNSNRRLLWHGSRSTNYGGILSQGLRIAPPEAPVSGYMFGKGVYFADISSKSANYCCSFNSGRVGLLLLCDVELGNPMQELTGANYNAGDDAKAKGCLATLGLGATAPLRWKDASAVHPSLNGVLLPDASAGTGASGTGLGLGYNEYIVYDVAQIRQRYLLKVYMG